MRQQRSGEYTKRAIQLARLVIALLACSRPSFAYWIEKEENDRNRAQDLLCTSVPKIAVARETLSLKTKQQYARYKTSKATESYLLNEGV